MGAMLKGRRRVSFLRRARVDDGAGNVEGEWERLCGPFWASLRPLNGKEEVLAQKLQGVQPYELIVRHCKATAGVTADDKVVDDRGVEYDVATNANPDMKNELRSMLLIAGKAVG